MQEEQKQEKGTKEELRPQVKVCLGSHAEDGKMIADYARFPQPRGPQDFPKGTVLDKSKDGRTVVTVDGQKFRFGADIPPVTAQRA